ncbi:hypothetical protein OROMI_009779 [Orobanche minor]
MIGFLYLRYVADPKTLWSWYEPYLKDDEECFLYLIAYDGRFYNSSVVHQHDSCADRVEELEIERKRLRKELEHEKEELIDVVIPCHTANATHREDVGKMSLRNTGCTVIKSSVYMDRYQNLMSL